MGKGMKKITWYVNENGCHICTSHCLDKDGYPKMQYKQNKGAASRVLWIKNFGEIPKGLVVRHKCDTPSCIKLDHLELGTYSDNLSDMYLRGRNVNTPGSKNAHAILNEDQVREILLSSKSQKELAKIYDVHFSTISKIKTKVKWKHVVV